MKTINRSNKFIFLLIVITLMVFAYAINTPETRTQSISYLEITYDSDNYIIYTNSMGSDAYGENEESIFTDQDFKKNIRKLLSSEDLEQIVYDAPHYCYDDQKENSILLALNYLPKNSSARIMLSNCRIPSDCLSQQNIDRLSLIDCDLTDMQAYHVKDLRLTRCIGMKWNDLNRYDLLESLYIDVSADGDDSDGYYPDDFGVFINHPTLNNLRLVIHSDDPDLLKLGRSTVFDANNKSEIELLCRFTPFNADEIRMFIDTGNRKVELIVADY